MNHTPGPWELDTAKDRDGRYHIVNGQLPRGINPEFGYPICDSSNRHHCITPQEDTANARLIAAAPQVLNALKELVRCVRGGDDTAGVSMDDALMDADAALELAGAA